MYYPQSCECSLFVKRFKSVCANFHTRGRHTPMLVRSDNEYFQSGFSNAEYFAELETTYHNSPIVVPLTHNDPTMRGNIVNGTVWNISFSFLWLYFLRRTFSQGSVDIYYGYAWLCFDRITRTCRMASPRVRHE
jgi:hypothetical protein